MPLHRGRNGFARRLQGECANHREAHPKAIGRLGRPGPWKTQRGEHWRAPRAQHVLTVRYAQRGDRHRWFAGRAYWRSERDALPAGWIVGEDVSVERRFTYRASSRRRAPSPQHVYVLETNLPAPGMNTFDAPDREVCVVPSRRARTRRPAPRAINDTDVLGSSP